MSLISFEFDRFSVNALSCESSCLYSLNISVPLLYFYPILMNITSSKWERTTSSTFCGKRSCSRAMAVEITKTNTASFSEVLSDTITNGNTLPEAIVAGIQAKYSGSGNGAGGADLSLTGTTNDTLQLYSTSADYTSTYTISKTDTYYSTSETVTCAGMPDESFYLESRVNVLHISGYLFIPSESPKKFYVDAKTSETYLLVGMDQHRGDHEKSNYKDSKNDPVRRNWYSKVHVTFVLHPNNGFVLDVDFRCTHVETKRGFRDRLKNLLG